MQTFAGVILAILAAAWLSALAAGQGRAWLRVKFLGQ